MQRVKHDPLVYYALRDGLVKIGTSTLLAQRMSRLDIDRILAVEPGSEPLEAQRHAQFADLRVDHHEWFRPSDDLLAHTDALRALHGVPDFTKRTARGEPILTAEHHAVLALLPPLVIPVPAGTLERFATRIRLADDGCRFRWIHSDKLTGYGTFRLGKNMGAHRASHLMFIGPVPDGWHVDHVRDWGCVNHDCVWWEHLEAVTPGVNVRRGDAAKPWAFCKWGHELTPDNVYLNGPDKAARRCKTCAIAMSAARNRRLHPNGRKPKTHCNYGHPLSGENLYVQPSNGNRSCWTCIRTRSRHRYQRLHGLELT